MALEGRSTAAPMLVYVRYNSGPGVGVKLAPSSSVLDLKESVGRHQGVPVGQLRVLFAGRELQDHRTLQECDLEEQSTVHVVRPSLPPPLQGAAEGLTRLDLPPSPSGPSALLQGAEPGATRSRFYVYCKSMCRAVRPGKLRVRCRACMQNTLSLSQDPSCWNDVLLPDRIHGICQSDGCHGSVAEFYLKCAVHPTSEDDQSVALDLIIANTRQRPCITCMDVMNPVLVFQCAERHVICLDCFHDYCLTRLNERQFIHDPVIGYTLPCPAGCPDSLIKELHHFRILEEQQYERYQGYGAEECLLQMGGVMCPSPGCGAGLLLPEHYGRRVCCETCRLGCGFVFCRDCREQFHEGACKVKLAPPTRGASQGYVVDQESSQHARWEQASRQTIEETTRPCPECHVPVERNGGCMHMACPRCKCEWCWLCALPWNRECMGSHWFG